MHKQLHDLRERPIGRSVVLGMAAGAGRRDGVVAVDGLEFERNDRCALALTFNGETCGM